MQETIIKITYNCTNITFFLDLPATQQTSAILTPRTHRKDTARALSEAGQLLREKSMIKRRPTWIKATDIVNSSSNRVVWHFHHQFTPTRNAATTRLLLSHELSGHHPDRPQC